MDKINFQDGTKVSSAKVTIDEVDYTVTPARYSGATPLSSTIMNTMQTNIENAINQNANNIGGEDYDNTETYEVGDIVKYEEQLYICIENVDTPEEFDDTKWSQTDVLSSAGGNEIAIGDEETVTGKTKLWIEDDSIDSMFSEVEVSPTEPTGPDCKVWFQKGKNNFNINDITEGMALNSDGTYGSSTVTNTSDFIKVKAGQYTLSYDYSSLANQTSRGYCFFDNNSTYISGGTYDPSNRTTTFTIVNDGYIRFSFDKNCTNIQLEQGSTATTYEAYIEPEIHTRNNNNVYEQFIMPENKVYSTGEIRIGTWISGKPLYRKVIQTTTPTVSSNGTSAWQQITFPNVSFAMLTNCQMYYVGPYGPVITPITKTILSAGLNQYISANVTINQSNNNGVLQIESSSTALNNRTIYAIIEYTKVTD